MSARTKILAHCWSNIYNWATGYNGPPARQSSKANIVFKPVDIRELREVTEILDGCLYLSGAAPLTATKLESLGITAIVCALTEVEERNVVSSSYLNSSIPKIYVRMLDSEASDISIYFDSIGKFIDEEISRGGKVLVHCLAGVSRSPALVIAYLIRYKNYTLMDAYDYVALKRKIIEPNDGFFAQLLAYERQLKTDSTTMTKAFMEVREIQDGPLSEEIMMMSLRDKPIPVPAN